MKRLITGALAGLALLVPAACGSDDPKASDDTERSDDESEDTADPSADEAPADSESAEPGAPEDSGDVSDDSTGGDGTGDDSIPELDDISIPDFSVPDFTIPDISDISVPEGFSEECAELYRDFQLAVSTVLAGGEGAQEAAEHFSERLQSEVPDDLRDEAQVMADGILGVAAVMASHNGNIAEVMADPEASAALDELDSDEYNEASDAIGEYFEDRCPGFDES